MRLLLRDCKAKGLKFLGFKFLAHSGINSIGSTLTSLLEFLNYHAHSLDNLNFDPLLDQNQELPISNQKFCNISNVFTQTLT